MIEIPLKSGSHEVKKADIARWREIYPGVNITRELLKMAEWCRANPERKKTKRGVNRFITSWLGRVKPADKPVFVASHKRFEPEKPRQITKEGSAAGLAMLKAAIK